MLPEVTILRFDFKNLLGGGPPNPLPTRAWADYPTPTPSAALRVSADQLGAPP